MVEVSVVVPSIGRTGLAALVQRACSSGPGTEVVVVDNSPDGDAVGPLPGARVVHEAAPGAARARNRGIAETTGGVVVFLDDDVRITDHTVSALAGPVLAGTARATVGRVRLDPAVTLPRWLTPPLLGYLSNHDRGPAERVLDHDDHGLTAAMAVERRLLEEVGGFWEELGPRPGAHLTNDDVQLCRAVHRAGARVRYVPAATVTHEVDPQRLRRRYVLRRAYQQGRSDWLLEAGWERRPAGRVLASGVADLGRAVLGNARRLRDGPGTGIRVGAALVRFAGLASGAVRDRSPAGRAPT